MDFFISLAAVAALTLFLIVRFKWNSAVAPFFTVLSVILFMCFCGLFGLLRVAGFLVYALALYSLYYVFVQKRAQIKESLRAFLQPGPVFFFVACTVFFFLIRAQLPAFRYWDEFSFWGIAGKTVFENGTLYTLCESSMINTSYPPGLSVIGYFFQFFGSYFTEWKFYLAYDVLHLAAVTVLFSRIRWKNIVSFVLTSFFALASIYLFLVTFDGMPYYCNAYADRIVGVLFGAALLCWFSDESRGFPRYLSAMGALMLLPYIKDIGFAFGLVGAVIIAFDMLVSKNYPSRTMCGRDKSYLRFLYAALMLAAVVFSYLSWTLHFNSVEHMARIEFPYKYSFMEIITGKDPYFLAILGRMIEALSTHQLVSFGPITDMLVVFFAVPLIGGLLTWDKKKFFRLCALSVELLGGFALYYVFQTYLYTAIFYHTPNYELVSFARYIGSYAIGWMYAAFGVLLFEVAAPRFKKLSLAPGVALCALLLASHFYYTDVHPDQYVFTSPKLDMRLDGLRQLIQTDSRDFSRYLTAEDRLYFVCQESAGGEWFVFNYEFQPSFTVETFGGGYFVPMDTPDSEMPNYGKRADRENFAAFLLEEGVDYLYVLQTDEYFYDEFNEMFDDNLRLFYDNTVHVYRVVQDNGVMHFVPLMKGAGIPTLNEQYGPTH